ncbi:MAG: hypothetical protein IT579_20060 [Verrucomicrobia subdivision 3 bacterium]|nr:hypothetical protein [Limisphaerales bacterium]
MPKTHSEAAIIEAAARTERNVYKLRILHEADAPTPQIITLLTSLATHCRHLVRGVKFQVAE